MEENAKFRWDERRVQANELFRDALNKTKFRESLFTEKFMEGLEKRRDALDARSRSGDVLQLTMLLLLLVAILFPDMSVSALGLSAKAANFRELLLVVIASLQIHFLPPSIERAKITDLIHVYVQRQAEGDPTILRVLQLRYGLTDLLTAVDLTGRDLSKRQTIFLVISAFSMILWLLGVLLLFIFVLLAGMVSIAIHPTLSIWVTILVCMYVLVVMVTVLAMRTLIGFLQMDQPRQG